MGISVGEIRNRLQEEVSRGEEGMNLARGALLMALEEYPQMPLEQYLGRLDTLAEEVQDRLAGEDAPPVVLGELVETLHGRHAFRGNEADYYDPRNLFLNDVLDRELGIPITLGIVFLEVGWRLGLPLEGVHFPAHFLIRYRGEAVRLLLDPFRNSQIRFEDQAQELLDRIYGGMVRLHPRFLRTAGRKDMLIRVARNLKGIHLNRADPERALRAVEHLLILRPGVPEEVRDRGILLARVGRREEAIGVLEDFLGGQPENSDLERIRRILDRLRKRGRDEPGSGDITFEGELPE
jgi:regulator of sirC expression with transglutaminase-like and TPR domain